MKYGLSLPNLNYQGINEVWIVITQSELSVSKQNKHCHGRMLGIYRPLKNIYFQRMIISS